MTPTTNERYLQALNEDMQNYTHKHVFSDTWLEDVLVNGEWKMVGFQKVDHLCFVLIGTRNWATRYTATSLSEAIRSEQWYEVTQLEGNEIYKKILQSKKKSKKGKIFYKWDF